MTAIPLVHVPVLGPTTDTADAAILANVAVLVSVTTVLDTETEVHHPVRLGDL